MDRRLCIISTISAGVNKKGRLFSFGFLGLVTGRKFGDFFVF